MSVYHIKTIKSSFDIECDPNSTIAEVKKLIVEKNPEFDINLITLLAKKGKTFNPTKCEDDKTIGSYETDQFTLRHQRAAKSTAAKAAAAPPPKAAVAPPPKSASSPTKAAAPPPAKAAAPPPAKAAAPPPAKVAAPPPAKAAAPPPAKAATPPPSNEAAQTPSSEIAPPPKSEEQQSQPNIQETPIQEKQQTQSDHPSINQEQKQIDIPSEDRITPNNEDVIQTITKEQIPPVTTSMPNPSIPPTITSTPTPLQQPNQTVHLSQTPTPSPPQSQPSDNLLDDDDDEFFSAREYNELVANFGKSPSAYADFIRFVERQNPDDAKFLKENAQALYCILRMPQFPDLSNLDKKPPQPKPQNNPSQQFTGRSNNFMQEPTFGYLNANAPGNFENPSNSFNDNFGIPGSGMNPPPFPGGNPPSFPGNPPSFPGNPPSFPGNPPSFPGNPPSFPGNPPSFPGNNSPSFPSSEINNPPFPGGGGSGGGMPNFGMPGPGSGMPSFGSPPPPPSTTSGPPTAFDLSDALSQLSQDEMDIFMKYTNSGLPLNELLNIFIEVAGKNEQTFVNILQSMK